MADIETLTDEERRNLQLLRKVATDTQGEALDRALQTINGLTAELRAAAGPCYALWQAAEARVLELEEAADRVTKETARLTKATASLQGELDALVKHHETERYARKRADLEVERLHGALAAAEHRVNTACNATDADAESRQYAINADEVAVLEWYKAFARHGLHVVSAADKSVLDAMAAIPDDDLEPSYGPGSDVVSSAALDLTAAMSRALDAELARREAKQ